MPASSALPELPLNQESEVNMLEKGQWRVNFICIFFHEICKSSNRIICRKTDSVWNSKHDRSIIIHICIGLPHIDMTDAHHDIAVTDMTHFPSLATGPNLQLCNQIFNCIKLWQTSFGCIQIIGFIGDISPGWWYTSLRGCYRCTTLMAGSVPWYRLTKQCYTR